jgi:hypothetical protein
MHSSMNCRCMHGSLPPYIISWEDHNMKCISWHARAVRGYTTETIATNHLTTRWYAPTLEYKYEDVRWLNISRHKDWPVTIADQSPRLYAPLISYPCNSSCRGTGSNMFTERLGTILHSLRVRIIEAVWSVAKGMSTHEQNCVFPSVLVTIY